MKTELASKYELIYQYQILTFLQYVYFLLCKLWYVKLECELLTKTYFHSSNTCLKSVHTKTQQLT